MNKYLITTFALVILIMVVVAGYVAFKNTATKNTLNNVATQNAQKAKIAAINKQNIQAETITLTNSGFQPQTLTITAGTRVVWVNNSGVTGAVNSDNYPTNLLYPLLNFGKFNDGSSFSTIFQKTGIYTYYNFLSQNQSQKGTITVK
jgi:plastocyanin